MHNCKKNGISFMCAKCCEKDATYRMEDYYLLNVYIDTHTQTYMCVRMHVRVYIHECIYT